MIALYTGNDQIFGNDVIQIKIQEIKKEEKEEMTTTGIVGYQNL